MLNDARAILAGHMNEWTEADICWPNMPPLTDGNKPWVRFTALSDGDGISYVSTPQGPMLETGLVSVQVFTPAGSGDGKASELADSIAGHFRYYSADGLNCGAVKKQTIGSNDGWYQINLTCRWHYSGEQ